MSSVTIQINSLEALERLIGGDAALEVDLRKSVVHAFIRKHCSAGHPNTPFITALIDAHSAAIPTIVAKAEASLLDSVFRYADDGDTPYFEPSSKLKSMVDVKLQKTVQAEVQKRWAALLPTIDEKMDAALSTAIERKATAVVEAHSASISKAVASAKAAIADLLK